MFKLLRADFARLWKTRSYWVCVIASSALCALNLVWDYIFNKGVVQNLERFFMDDSSNIMLFAAIFSALYIGTDYSCGTIRNKLIIGRPRSRIYLSNLIVTIAGALSIRVISWIGEALFVLIAGGKIGIPAGRLALLMTVSTFSIVSACSIFTFIGMIISSKSSGTVISIVTIIALIIGGAIIMTMLDQPEMTIGYIMKPEGGFDVTEPYPNPMYISGALREVLTAINDLLPGGQAIQLEMGEPHEPQLMPLHSLGVAAVVTAAGLAVFRKKDMK